MKDENQRKEIAKSIKEGKKERDKKNIEIGKRIKQLRNNRGETQDQLAVYMELSQINISKIECGEIALTLQNLLKIAKHYDVSLDYLCNGTGESTILEILKRYFNVSKRNLNEGDSEHFIYPVFEIDRAFFDYLFQIYEADNSMAPPEIKDTWRKKVTAEFFEKNTKGISSFVPVPPEFIYPDEKKDWTQADLIREIDCYFRDSISRSEDDSI